MKITQFVLDTKGGSIEDVLNYNHGHVQEGILELVNNSLEELLEKQKKANPKKAEVLDKNYAEAKNFKDKVKALGGLKEEILSFSDFIDYDSEEEEKKEVEDKQNHRVQPISFLAPIIDIALRYSCFKLYEQAVGLLAKTDKQYDFMLGKKLEEPKLKPQHNDLAYYDVFPNLTHHGYHDEAITFFNTFEPVFSRAAKGYGYAAGQIEDVLIKALLSALLTNHHELVVRLVGNDNAIFKRFKKFSSLVQQISDTYYEKPWFKERERDYLETILLKEHHVCLKEYDNKRNVRLKELGYKDKGPPVYLPQAISRWHKANHLCLEEYHKKYGSPKRPFSKDYQSYLAQNIFLSHELTGKKIGASFFTPKEKTKYLNEGTVLKKELLNYLDEENPPEEENKVFSEAEKTRINKDARNNSVAGLITQFTGYCIKDEKTLIKQPPLKNKH